MPFAAFQCRKYTASGVSADCSKHPCFLDANIVSTDIDTYPMPAPTSPTEGTTYSYVNVLEWKCTVAPQTQVTGFKIFGPDHRPDDPAYYPEQDPGNKLTIYFGNSVTFYTPIKTLFSSVTMVRQDTNYYSALTGMSVPITPGDSKIDAIDETVRYAYIQLYIDYLANQGDMNQMMFGTTYTET